MALFTNKSEDLISRQFFGALKNTRKSSGASLSLNIPDWPMRFQYRTDDVTQDSLSSIDTSTFNRDSKQFSYFLNHNFSEFSRINFKFDRNEIIQRRTASKTKITGDRYSLSHNLVLGKNKQHRLHSFISNLNQSGISDVKNLQWQERLSLIHSDTLRSNYEFKLTDYKRAETSAENKTILAGFEHRLYKSLVTTGNIFTSSSEFGGQGDLLRSGSALGFRYTKKNLWGTLLGSYVISASKTEQTGGNVRVIVIDELHTVPVGLGFIELDRTNVDISTIVVKDSNGLPFTVVEDYRIEEINGKVRLEIIVLSGGDPPNFTSAGQAFFVDYQTFVRPENKEDRLHQDFSIRERFNNGFSAFYSHQRQDEKISSSETDITPDEFRVNILGVDYTKKGLYLLAEYKKRESEQVPSTNQLLSARYSCQLDRDTRLSLRILNQWLELEETSPRDVKLFDVGGEIFSRLSDKYDFFARISYRDEQDSRYGNTKGIQFVSELQYQYRQIFMTTGIEFNFLERRNTENRNTFVYFRLKRMF